MIVFRRFLMVSTALLVVADTCPPNLPAAPNSPINLQTIYASEAIVQPIVAARNHPLAQEELSESIQRGDGLPVPGLQSFKRRRRLANRTRSSDSSTLSTAGPENRAIIFGMGNLSRAYLAPLLTVQNHFEAVFIDNRPNMVNEMNREKSYMVNPIGEGDIFKVENVSAVQTQDEEAIAALGPQADWIFTAVRAENIEALAPTLGRLIESRLAQGRTQPLNVIFVENLSIDQPEITALCDKVLAYNPDAEFQRYVRESVGFVSTVVDVTVPEQKEDPEHPLDIRVEGGHYDLVYDATVVRGTLPLPAGFRPTTNIVAERERKLLIHNLGHALLAYLAAVTHKTMIADAMEIPTISLIVQYGMQQSAAALAAKYPDLFNPHELSLEVSDLMSRFSNRALGDTVERVARNPIRKLSRGERLFAALENITAYRLDYEAVLLGITAAVRYAKDFLAISSEELEFVSEQLREYGYLLSDLDAHFRETWNFVLQKVSARQALELLVTHLIDNTAAWHSHPRVVLFDIDGTLVDKTGDDLETDMARNLHAVAETGVNEVIASGISEERLERDIIPALRGTGPGNHFLFYAGGGGFFATYDRDWHKTVHYRMTFRELQVGDSFRAELLTQPEFDQLTRMIQEAVGPNYTVEYRGTHFVVFMKDEDLAHQAAMTIERTLQRTGFNKQLEQRLAATLPSPWKENIRVRARMSRTGILNVLLVSKSFILNHATHYIEQQTGGIVDAAHTLIVDDSLAMHRGGSFFNGLDLARTTIRGENPLVYNVGGINPGDLLDPHVRSSVARRGPKAVMELLSELQKEIRTRHFPLSTSVAIQTGKAPETVPLPQDWPASWRQSVQAFGNGVYRINAKPTHPRNVFPNPVLSERLHRNQPFESPTRRQNDQLKTFFEDAVSIGWIEPIVIVNIKNLYPDSSEYYIDNLLRISEYYNGHLTFMLVEENPHAFRNDFPSAFSALDKAKEVLGSDFYEHPVLLEADGGRKLRGFPITLRYGYQGLIPYSNDRTYLQEGFARAGSWLLQMPDYGKNHLVMIPSDGIFNFDRVSVDGKPLSEWQDTHKLLIPLAKIPDPENVTQKVVAGRDASGVIQFVLAKPNEESLQDRQKMSPSVELWTLPFWTVWDKRALLDPFLNELRSTRMSNGESFLEFPGDLFATLIEPLYRDPNGNGRTYEGFEKDRVVMTGIARRFFGAQGSNISWPVMEAKDAFTDEGHLRILRRRARVGQSHVEHIEKDPRIHLAGMHFLTGDRIVLRGSGQITIGNNVQMKNVVIDLGENGEMTIPNGWILHDAYLGPGVRLEGESGFLSGVIGVDSKMQPAPIQNQRFPGNYAVSEILTLDHKMIPVPVPLQADEKTIESLRFGPREWTAPEVQSQTDVWRMRQVEALFSRMIDAEFSDLPAVFPMDSRAVQPTKILPYTAWVNDIADYIVRHQAPNQHFDVTIEGLQGAGKSYLAKELRKALRKLGHKHVIVYEEDWVTKPRAEREALRNLHAIQWRQHRETWHRWSKLAADDEILRNANGRVKLTELYDRAKDGQAVKTKQLNVYADTIFIHTGFYLSDTGRLDLPDDPKSRLKIYMGITQNQSLDVKRFRDQWRPRQDIEEMDEKVFRPALAEYHTLFDPASSADIVVRVHPKDRSFVEIVVPLRRLAILNHHIFGSANGNRELNSTRTNDSLRTLATSL